MLNWFGRKLQEAQKNEGGFTLIELLVVVIIIGILAAIAIPTFLGQRQRAYDAQAETTARNAATAAHTYFVDEQSYEDMDAAALNGIEGSLPAAEDGGAYAADGGNYDVAVDADFKDFTITVEHPQGSKEFVFDQSGLQ